MTGMQRYYAGEVIGDGKGPFVLASDAEAAIAAAEQRGYELGRASREDADTAYAMGQRDMLARCIEAVYALVTTRGYDLDDYSAAEALAALRALGGGDE